MHIKKDDNVKVISGSDKGKTGKVLRAIPQKNRIIVENINMKKRHRKATKEGGKGQMIDIAHPIHVSNVKKEA